MRVAEIFESINGEGPLAGQRALFLRFAGCNISCAYCDTAWANEPGYTGTQMSVDEILLEVKKAQIRNITITGGEPLLQEDMPKLLKALADTGEHRIEIETNGTIDLTPFCDIGDDISFTMDYKLPGSGMEDAMCMENFRLLKENDSVKFVVGSAADLTRALEVIQRERLQGRCHVFLSPVFGEIDPEEIVEYIKENRLDRVNLQLQLHKIIWAPEQRGV
jgi:7-carboxy-7-deazaguanine synthase